MQVQRFDIDGPALLISPVYPDVRGAFLESYNSTLLTKALGFDPGFVQDNISRSVRASTLRGLHLQRPPYAQGKLIRCISGQIMDVFVDVRPGSEHFGQHICADLKAEDGRALWVPEGFLHGFITREPETIVTYKVTNVYNKPADVSVRWDDPDLAIDWGSALPAPILAEKDANGLSFADYKASIKAAS